MFRGVVPAGDAALRVVGEAWRWTVERMFLRSIEEGAPRGVYADSIRALEAAGMPVPQIMRLFAFKPERTVHLARFTQEAMRGPSPLSPGLRELIAAYTSKLNHCPF